MATAQVAPDNNTVTAEIFIAAPPDRVFQAITDPAQTRQWWGQRNLYRVTESHSDPRPGGKWSSVGVGAIGTSETRALPLDFDICGRKGSCPLYFWWRCSPVAVLRELRGFSWRPLRSNAFCPRNLKH
jgi:hypothetical protein